jgi:hypothetical protein
MRENQKTVSQKIKDFFAKKIGRAFYFEHWNVGVLDFPIQEILNITPEILWIKNNVKRVK